MTEVDIIREILPGASEKLCNDILWSETAFPMADVRHVYYQLRAAARAKRNGIRRCEMCGMMLPYHSRGCVEIIGWADKGEAL